MTLTADDKRHCLTMLMRTLRTMEMSQSIEQLVLKIKGFSPNRELAVAFVADTSFLMLERMPAAWDWLNALPRSGLATHFSIPNVAVDEVARHFGSEKDQQARIARKRIAQMVEKMGAIEPLNDVTPIDPFDSMSADSETDRRIIAFAQRLAEDHRFVCVLLATDDGGIMYDVARLRRDGARLGSLTKESAIDDLHEFVCCWIAQSTWNDQFLCLISGAKVVE